MFTVKLKVQAEARARYLSVKELLMVRSSQLSIVKYLRRIADPREHIVVSLLNRGFQPSFQLLRTVVYSQRKANTTDHYVIKSRDRHFKFIDKRLKRLKAMQAFKRQRTKLHPRLI